MMTAPLMRNATFKHETANPFASDHPVPLEHVVKQITTERYVPAITHFKEMDMFRVQNVSISILSHTSKV